MIYCNLFKKGLITTYYVCRSVKFPNMFTFSPSAESVYAAWPSSDWQQKLHDAKGILNTL